MNKNTALIIIDVQEAFEDEKWGVRNNPQAEENISRILTLWRENGWKVIHIQHTSDNPDSLFHPGNKGFSIKESVQPKDGEEVITKKVNSSFIGTDLEGTLKRNDISTVVITGLTTPHCVSTTTRMSGNLGFDTYLVSDATAAFGLPNHDNIYHDAETIHHVSLATLHGEFATIVSTGQLLDKIR
ncbi:cysteine hydrolase family protein [Sediminibacillus halophilus]|uniref:Nicotinamidase-related amidase n=1 Tax=Sediminibacillus halophilus TaxID=482461 RepID=A0A1G9V6L0_9BACI|nr:cysteine hydrolase family protein [Sediminibacillus halophilus]SDM67791.1 Nicotinamidase-related amidase [Sediminibacillus halophilus]